MSSQPLATTHPEPDDLFEDVLNLEDQYYTEGYNLGIADGSRAGLIEGRVFGLEKGYEKFAEMGRVGGRAAVWQGRLPSSRSASSGKEEIVGRAIPALGESERLRKHIDRLVALTEAETMPTENSEEGVADFDDRLKEAKAKAKLISKIVGEDESGESGLRPSIRQGEASGSKSTARQEGSESKARTGEMEDFTGLPFTKGPK